MEQNNIDSNDIEKKIELLNDKLDQFTANCSEQYGYKAKSNYMPYVRNSSHLEHKALDDFIRKGIVTKNLTEFENGKVLLSQSTNNSVLNTMTHMSALRKVAKVDTISSHSLDVIVEAEHINAGWADGSPANIPTVTGPRVTKINVQLKEMYVQPYTTQAVIEDAVIDVAQWLINSISNAFVAAENHSFIFGDGINQPQGILNTAGIERIGTDKGKICAIDIMTVINSMDERYLRNATFLMNRKTLQHIYSVLDHNGAMIWRNHNANNSTDTLFGIPVVCCDEMPYRRVINVPVVILADFKQAYQIVQSKSSISIMKDPYTYKPYVKFYATKRVGGAVVNKDAMRILFMGKSESDEDTNCKDGRVQNSEQKNVSNNNEVKAQNVNTNNATNNSKASREFGTQMDNTKNEGLQELNEANENKEAKEAKDVKENNS